MTAPRGPRPRPGAPRPLDPRTTGEFRLPGADPRTTGEIRLGPGGRRPERLHIDWTACDGRGLCTELLPELLDRDEWGYPKPREGVREPVVPPSLRAHAERAVASCPVLALTILT